MKYSIYWIRALHHKNPFEAGYIGVSNQPEARFRAHTTDTGGVGSKVVKAYVEKHGLDSIVHEILGEYSSFEEAQSIEALYRPDMNIGWNIAKGGGVTPDCSGRVHSQETKDKIQKGVANTKLGRTYESHFKGATNRWSEEQKKVIGAAHKGKTISEEHKQSAHEKLYRDKSPKAVKFKVRNIHTGEIREYGSIGSAADDLKITYSTVRSARQRKNLMAKAWEFID